MFSRRARSALLALSLAACGVSDEQEVALGREAAAEVAGELPIVTDPAVTGFVTELGLALARQTERGDLAWHFHVVNSMEVNAFALPGGFIYLNRGLIERMESLDQLAGVLGHEIGHVVRRHSVERMEKAGRANVGVSLVCSLTEWCQSQSAQVAINVAGSAWLARHSRADEAEADSVAVITVLLAGISPGGVASMFQVLLAERQAQPTFVDAWFGTHPLEESRIERTRQHIALIEPAALEGLLEDTPEFQQMRARLSMLPPPPPPPARLAPR